MSINAVKQELLSKLKQEHCFWSYNESSIKDIPDVYIKSMATRHFNKMLITNMN